MRGIGYLFSLATLLLTVGLARSGGGDADEAARATVAKAIKAHGGEDNLGKIKATSLKGNGKVYIGGDSFDFTAEWQVQAPTQQKFTVDVTVNGMAFKVTKVVNGDKGWQSIAGNTAPLSKEELAEELHGLYVGHLQQLVPLKDKAFKLAPLGEVKVNDKDAIAICITSKDRRDVNFYFDKNTHLLVKAESRINDQGKEVNEEIFFKDYKAVDGVQQPYKLTIMRDGKRFVEGELTEVRIHTQKLDDSIFAKP